MGLTKPHTLSDGTTMRVRVRATIAGTYFDEVPSRERRAHTLYRLGNSMCLVWANDILTITNPDYRYASDDKAGAEVAMRFFVDAAEGCIAEAARCGLPVDAMYGPI